MRYEVRSGRLDVIRTSFLAFPNPNELETQLDLLRDLCLQNEIIEEAKGNDSEILSTDKTDSQPNPAEILYHTGIINNPAETVDH